MGIEKKGIKLEKIDFQYKDRPIYHNFDLDIETGEFVIIVGSSGSGKTTLLNLINGSITPQGGHIYIDGKNLRDKLDIDVYRNIYLGYIFQDYKLLENLSAIDNIRLPLEIGKKTYSNEDIYEYARKLGIEDVLNQRCNKLSGGEKQRVAIARAIINKPEYLLADEPTGNVDFECRKEIMDILTSLNKQGQTIIMITCQNADYLRRFPQII